jgi:UTP-glucose-1-phosphate uridylyltransferase
MAAQQHPEVICHIDETGNASDDEEDGLGNKPVSKEKGDDTTAMDAFVLKPEILIHAAKTEPTRASQMKLCEHMTNLCARKNIKQ